jgi:hypothetical protein
MSIQDNCPKSRLIFLLRQERFGYSGRAKGCPVMGGICFAVLTGSLVGKV